MNSYKRFLALVLALCLMLGLCACGGNSDGTEPTDGTSATDATDATDATEAAKNGYTVKVVDEGGNPIANAMVQLCFETCLPKPTDANGTAYYDVAEADYKVSFLVLPAGYTYTTDEQEFHFAAGSKEMTIVLKAVA